MHIRINILIFGGVLLHFRFLFLKKRRRKKRKFFERMFTPTARHMSHVTCHVSRVTGHLSHVMSRIFLLPILDLVGGGSVIIGPTPSSIYEWQNISPPPAGGRASLALAGAPGERLQGTGGPQTSQSCLVRNTLTRPWTLDTRLQGTRGPETFQSYRVRHFRTRKNQICHSRWRCIRFLFTSCDVKVSRQS